MDEGYQQCTHHHQFQYIEVEPVLVPSGQQQQIILQALYIEMVAMWEFEMVTMQEFLALLLVPMLFQSPFQSQAHVFEIGANVQVLVVIPGVFALNEKDIPFLHLSWRHQCQFFRGQHMGHRIGVG